MIISKVNKNAISRYKTIERKIAKSQANLSDYKKKKEELLASIPYPIFIREGKEKIIAYLNKEIKIVVRVSNSSYSYSPLCSVEYHDVSGNNSYEKVITIEHLNDRTTKKEFMKHYKEAQDSIRKSMTLSTRAKKEMLCEKTIKETQMEESEEEIFFDEEG